VWPIQRVPRGLSQLLSTFGGQTPAELKGDVQSVLELLQFYGKTQWQLRQTNDPVMAEGGVLSMAVPANESWVLFSMAGLIAKTATMTALRSSLLVGPDNLSASAIFSAELGPFGATETGSARFGFALPYPFFLPPLSRCSISLDILGTDANANVLLTASVGVLG
jgi:hypothetical protein